MVRGERGRRGERIRSGRARTTSEDERKRAWVCYDEGAILGRPVLTTCDVEENLENNMLIWYATGYGGRRSYSRLGRVISCGVRITRVVQAIAQVLLLDQEKTTDENTAITFLAQWHPLIQPQRSDLRPEYIHHEGPGGSRF